MRNFFLLDRTTVLPGDFSISGVYYNCVCFAGCSRMK